MINRLKKSDVDVIQLRDKESAMKVVLKDALLLKKALLNTSKIFIVNDYPQIARLADSDGVHLGQRDARIGAVKKLLGKGKIIGVSCHSLKQAKEAQKKGADYIGIGPVFRTPTKPEYRPVGLKLIRESADAIRIPSFAIGGVNRKNMPRLLAAGGKRIAVCRAILEEKNVELAANNIFKALV